MSNCPNCGARMVRYTPFDSIHAEGEPECLKGCKVPDGKSILQECSPVSHGLNLGQTDPIVTGNGSIGGNSQYRVSPSASTPNSGFGYRYEPSSSPPHKHDDGDLLIKADRRMASDELDRIRNWILGGGAASAGFDGYRVWAVAALHLQGVCALWPPSKLGATPFRILL